MSVLWELGNAALRPALYFLCHPAVWQGLKGLCGGSRRWGEDSYLEIILVLQQLWLHLNQGGRCGHGGPSNGEGLLTVDGHGDN